MTSAGTRNTVPRAVAAVRSREKRRRVRQKVKDTRRNRAAAEVVRAVASTGAEVEAEVLHRNRKHQSRTRHHPIDTRRRLRHMTGSRRSAHRSISTAMMSTTRDANRSRRRANNAVLPGTSAPAFSDNAAMTQTTGSRQRATKMATSQGELANLFIFIHLE